MIGYIYCIKENNKVIYVGCTKNFKHRKGEHFHCIRTNETKMQPIQRYIVKNNLKDDCMEILLEKDFIDLKEMYYYESFYIDKYNTFNDGLNYNEGGASSGTGVKNSNARRIICENTGEVFNCIKDACNKYNLVASEMSSHLNRKRYINGIGKNKVGYNLMFTYLDIEKDTRNLSEETKQKVRMNNKKNCKKIRDNNLNKIFDSLKEACEYYNISKGTLSSIINYKIKSKKYFYIDMEYIN